MIIRDVINNLESEIRDLKMKNSELMKRIKELETDLVDSTTLDALKNINSCLNERNDELNAENLKLRKEIDILKSCEVKPEAVSLEIVSPEVVVDSETEPSKKSRKKKSEE